jgi:hypothetical protein
MEKRLSVTRNFTLTLYPFPLALVPPFSPFSEQPLGAGELAFQTSVTRTSVAQCAGERFEYGFHRVVARPSVEHSEMYVGPGAGSESLEEIFQQFGLKVANALRSNGCPQYEVGATAQVDSCHRQRFIHGHYEVACAVDASFVAQRLPHGLTQDKACVFDCVVLIDVQIALNSQIEIEATVSSEKFQHVIEKPNAGGDRVPAPTVEAQTGANVGLRRAAINPGRAGFHAKHPVGE